MLHIVIRDNERRIKRIYITTDNFSLNEMEQRKPVSYIMSSSLHGQGSQRLNWQGFEAHTTQVSVMIPNVPTTPKQDENGEGRS